MSDAEKLDAEEWANWALFGAPEFRCPSTLKPIHGRIVDAINQARSESKPPLTRAERIEQAARDLLNGDLAYGRDRLRAALDSKD